MELRSGGVADESLRILDTIFECGEVKQAMHCLALGSASYSLWVSPFHSGIVL